MHDSPAVLPFTTAKDTYDSLHTFLLSDEGLEILRLLRIVSRLGEQERRLFAASLESLSGEEIETMVKVLERFGRL